MPPSSTAPRADLSNRRICLNFTKVAKKNHFRKGIPARSREKGGIRHLAETSTPAQAAQAAPPIQTPQSYQIKKPQTVTAPPPVQSHNTDYSTNPVVIFKETMAWFREHKKVTATIIKLGYATIAVVVLLILVVNGRTLLPFIVNKSSYLIAKVTGSSDEKPPENRVKIRTVPGAKTENPDNPGANSGENALVSPGTRTNPVLPPPPPTDAGATAGPNPQDSATAATTPDQSGERSSTAPPEITSLNLPSGKTFKARLFKVELSTLSDLFKDTAKDDPVLCIYYPDGKISALTTHNKGVLNGVTMAFYEDYKPKIYAAYADGAIDGIIKLWNEKGERIYYCQYEKGVRNGFCCYFKDNALQMILEIDHDTINGIHLCAGGDLKKSFSSVEQASADKVAQKLLDEVDGLETELKLNEGLFKKQVKDELQRLKQEKMGIMTPPKRAAIQETRQNARISKPIAHQSFAQLLLIVTNLDRLR